LVASKGTSSVYYALKGQRFHDIILSEEAGNYLRTRWIADTDQRQLVDQLKGLLKSFTFYTKWWAVLYDR